MCQPNCVAGEDPPARYCARPPLSQERLGRLNDELLVYTLRRRTVDGRTELLLTPAELLERLAQLVPPPRLHKHRYCGVLAPNAGLRKAVTASAGPAGATLQVLQDARQEMGLPKVAACAGSISPAVAPQGALRFDQTSGPGDWPEMDQTA